MIFPEWRPSLDYFCLINQLPFLPPGGSMGPGYVLQLWHYSAELPCSIHQFPFKHWSKATVGLDNTWRETLQGISGSAGTYPPPPADRVQSFQTLFVSIKWLRPAETKKTCNTNLLSQFINYKGNEVLWIQALELML